MQRFTANEMWQLAKPIDYTLPENEANQPSPARRVANPDKPISDNTEWLKGIARGRAKVRGAVLEEIELQLIYSQRRLDLVTILGLSQLATINADRMERAMKGVA